MHPTKADLDRAAPEECPAGDGVIAANWSESIET
jgi:hypothetical protein